MYNFFPSDQIADAVEHTRLLLLKTIKTTIIQTGDPCIAKTDFLLVLPNEKEQQTYKQVLKVLPITYALMQELALSEAEIAGNGLSWYLLENFSGAAALMRVDLGELKQLDRAPDFNEEMKLMATGLARQSLIASKDLALTNIIFNKQRHYMAWMAPIRRQGKKISFGIEMQVNAAPDPMATSAN